MIELGQLEARHEDFDKRKVRIVVVSVEGLEDAKKTKAQFPDLVVLADEQHGLTETAKVLHKGAGQQGEDVDAPTTILIDRKGRVQWWYRSGEVIARLSPDDVLKAITEHMPEQK
jgi:peroxiredoxin